jgi:hypothetical protein
VPSVSKKLFLKPGDSLLLLEAPAGHRALFKDVELVAGSGEVPHVLLYVHNKQELTHRLPAAAKRLLGGGTLWVAYPKGKKLDTDLNRDLLWKAMEPEGFEGVRLVSLDDTWSAMMFRKR